MDFIIIWRYTLPHQDLSLQSFIKKQGFLLDFKSMKFDLFVIFCLYILV